MLWQLDGSSVLNPRGEVVRTFASETAAQEYLGVLEKALEVVLAGNMEPYGDVEYADPGFQRDGKKRYPIDTAEHCRAAWDYINHPHNESLYTPQQVAEIKGKIRAAAKKLGVEIAG